MPVPFVDKEQGAFIECYCDSETTLDGVQYTIGVPCDHSVALCYFNAKEQLIPVELDEELMDDIFPIAETIVEDEFGEELALQRTPQTLTLVGELEEEDDEEDAEAVDDDKDDEEDETPYAGDEEVEVLLSFEHGGKEFNLVRLMDPVLLVGKTSNDEPGKRLLLSAKESSAVMPVLEQMFLSMHDVNE